MNTYNVVLNDSQIHSLIGMVRDTIGECEEHRKSYHLISSETREGNEQNIVYYRALLERLNSVVESVQY